MKKEKKDENIEKILTLYQSATHDSLVEKILADSEDIFDQKMKKTQIDNRKLRCCDRIFGLGIGLSLGILAGVVFTTPLMPETSKSSIPQVQIVYVEVPQQQEQTPEQSVAQKEPQKKGNLSSVSEPPKNLDDTINEMLQRNKRFKVPARIANYTVNTRPNFSMPVNMSIGTEREMRNAGFRSQEPGFREQGLRFRPDI